MAWTDAARAAAAEARRAHSKARSSSYLSANIRRSLRKIGDRQNTLSIYKWDKVGTRQRLAMELRAVRKGQPTRTGLKPKTLAAMAVQSTRYRNANWGAVTKATRRR